MVTPIPLHQVIGARLRQLREGAGLRQEDIATQARAAGFADWARGTVAMIEGGRRRVTLEEFLALPLVLASAGIVDVSLADLISAEAPVLLNAQTTISAEALREALAGRGLLSAPAPAGRPEPVRDTEERQEALAIWRRWASGRFVHPREPHPAVISAAVVESRSDVVARAARVLQTSPMTVAMAGVLTWGRLLMVERDDRVRQRIGEGAPDSRTVQAIRGHVTRELLDELRPIVNAMKAKSRKGKGDKR